MAGSGKEAQFRVGVQALYKVIVRLFLNEERGLLQSGGDGAGVGRPVADDGDAV